ncbi:hypothetical protein ACP70R_017648 [Stipagrostis hirtigluma subsp. patula]
MALEAVVFSEGLFGCWAMAAPGGGGGWSWGHGNGGAMEGMLEFDGGSDGAYWDAGASSSLLMQGVEEPDGRSAAPPPVLGGGGGKCITDFDQEGAAAAEMTPPPAAGRRKRRRTRSVKNKEEVESQRMTHIAVERNRRKQMNEYLAVLRSLMPPSYVQRGDQASVIGGAINYVKELEQLLQSLEARIHARSLSPGAGDDDAAAATAAFAGFFTFPQYSMSAGRARSPAAANTDSADNDDNADANADADADDAAASGSRQSAVADIEVTMVESHANLRVLSRRRPRQLLRVVAGLQGHRLTVLHLNATSAGEMALYSLSLKVEDDCRLSSVDDIAAAVHRIVEAVELEQEEERAAAGSELRSELEQHSTQQ